MKSIEHVLIAGAGAIGLMVAHQIYNYKSDAVSILAKGERLDRYRKNGLFVNEKKIDVTIVDADKTIEESYPKTKAYPGLIIIACKNQHLVTILEDIKNYIGPETLILSLLNGISSEKTIAEQYGKKRVPLAMILGTDAQHSNEHTAYNQTGTIYFGDNQNDSTDDKITIDCSQRVQNIANFFEKAHISYAIPKNMLRKLWYKFLVNVGINQATAMLSRTYAPFQTQSTIPEALELVHSLQREVIAVSKYEGVGLGEGGDLCEEDILESQKVMDGLTSTSRTSMSQDVKAERKTEVELFSKTVSDLGKKHGVPTPANDMAYLILRTIEQSYKL